MHMRKIFLINMPFANLTLPSIGLTQLKSVVDKTFKDQVSVEIAYLNQDFAHYLGGMLQLRRVNDSPNSHVSGIGDWFFRRSAFPDLPDNQEAYFKRYYPQGDEVTKGFLDFIVEKREHLDDFLDAQIDKYGMGDAFMVGFTSMFSQNVACLAMAKRLKKRNPNIITVMGGANCEAPMGKEIVKHVEQIDYVFSGPALKSFPQLLQHCLDEQRDKCHSINGVFTKENCRPRASLVTIGGGCGTVRDIGDELDINTNVKLDYQSFLDTYFNNFPKARRPTLTFETARGCWWGQRAHCTFCGLNGATMAYRSMRPELALDQINSVFSYAPRVRRYECVDNILDKSYLKEVLPKIETPSNAIIFYEVKADLTEEEMQVLARARVKEIQPGIESLATTTLQLMKKGTTVFTNIYLLKNCRYYDIIPAWNLLVGFPGEGKEVYEKYLTDIPLLAHLYPPSGVQQVRFDRYSPYFTKAEAYGLELTPMDFYSYIYPFTKESITDLAYYFTDTNLSAEYLTTMIRWIDKIRQKFDVWEAKWKGNDPTKPPRLHFQRDGENTVVYDSRFERPVEHRLSPTAIEILKISGQRQTAGGVAQALAHVPRADVDKEIAELTERGLLFWEGVRFISLVLPGPPLVGAVSQN
jgi:ribosomal peptide maturation radical SAM protein 1